MNALGLIMVALGGLAGSLAAILDPAAVNWVMFLPALGVGIAGVAILRITASRHSKSDDKLASDIDQINQSLGRIVAGVTDLDERKDSIDVYDLPEMIDDSFIVDINEFVEARESLIHVHGVQAYADLMSLFAAGERYLNRVWSAAAEGYIDEAHAYLGHARARLGEAKDKLDSMQAA